MSVDVTEGSCGSPGIWGKVSTTYKYTPGDFNDGYIVKATGGTTCGPTPFTDIYIESRDSTPARQGSTP